jgi:hypothetical protein
VTAIRRTQQRSSLLAGLAIGLIVTTALVHLVQAPEDLSEVAVRGYLFVLNGLLGLVAAVGIAQGSRTWGWGLGLLVAGGALIVFIVSRSVGLPAWQDSVGEWLEPIAVLSFLVELAFVAIAGWVLTQRDDV